MCKIVLAKFNKTKAQFKNKYGGINKEGIALTKKFVSGKLKEGEKLPRWAERFKEHFSVSGDKLMLDGKEVIAKEDRDKVHL